MLQQTASQQVSLLLDRLKDEMIQKKAEADFAAKLNTQVRHAVRKAAKNDPDHANQLTALLSGGYLRSNLSACQSDMRYCRRKFAAHQHSYGEAMSRFNARLDHVAERYTENAIALLNAAQAISREPEFLQEADHLRGALGMPRARALIPVVIKDKRLTHA